MRLALLTAAASAGIVAGSLLPRPEVAPAAHGAMATVDVSGADVPAVASGFGAQALQWQRVPADVAVAGGAGPDLVLSGLAAVPGDLVAVGADRRGGVILRSSEGLRWVRQADDPSFDQSVLSAVAHGPTRTIVVARNRQRVWTSYDEVSWRSSGLAGSTSTVDVAASTSAYLVAGTFRLLPDATGYRRIVPAVWVSPDAAAWQRVLLPSLPVRGDIRPTLVRSLGARFVLFARVDGASSPSQVLVWTSADGRRWLRGHDIVLPRAGSLVDATVRPDGALLVAGWTSTAPAAAVMYVSPDGHAWSRLPGQPGFDGAVIRGVQCDKSGCVAVGATAVAGPAEARSWTSADGASWTATPDIAALGAVGLARVARSGDRVVAVGWARTPLADGSAVDAGAFWIAPPTVLPDPIPPAPVPVIAGRWEPVASMHVVRVNPAAALGADGRIYVFGGRTRVPGSTGTVESASMEVYDPPTDTWTLGPTIPGPGRTRSAAVTAADGRIFLFHRGNPLVVVYDPSTRAWSTGPSVPGGRYVSSAVRGPGRAIYVAAARAQPLLLFVLDSGTGRWAERGPVAQVPQALAADGHLYAVSPWRAYEIDRVTAATRLRAPTPELGYGQAVLGPGGLVWQVGYGYDYPAPGFTGRWMVSRVQAYDPVSNAWAIGPLPARPRYAHALVAAGNRLYAIGGSAGGSTSGVEVLIVDSPVPVPQHAA